MATTEEWDEAIEAYHRRQREKEAEEERLKEEFSAVVEQLMASPVFQSWLQWAATNSRVIQVAEWDSKIGVSVSQMSMDDYIQLLEGG